MASKGFPNDSSANYPYSDLHALFAADISYNSSRSNLPFGTCDASCLEKVTENYNGKGGSSGVYPGSSNWRQGSGSTGTWEVWEERRGDVARAMFYMAVRYEGGTHGISIKPDLELTDDLSLIGDSNTGSNSATGYMGRLSVLLEWHEADPVDDAERARNDSVANAQGNRNPFIDNPDYVASVFKSSGLGEDDQSNQAPTAIDVYSATLVRTSKEVPQFATVVLEGLDTDFDELTYEIVSLPAYGKLTDPSENDATVSVGTVAGRKLIYTPDIDSVKPDFTTALAMVELKVKFEPQILRYLVATILRLVTCQRLLLGCTSVSISGKGIVLRRNVVLMFKYTIKQQHLESI